MSIGATIELIVGAGDEALTLPAQTAQQRVAIVGMSGSGKTVAGKALCEETIKTELVQVGVFDVTDVWWGLRSSADGASQGYAAVVFGGKHADVPLTVDSGVALAKAFLSKRFHAVFSLRHLSESEIRRWISDFLGVINTHEGGHRHLFMDELDVYCPQTGRGEHIGEAQAAINTTVRRGRSSGIGVTMITQNPQDVDKSVLNQAEVVIAMRTAGFQQMEAIRRWMGRNLDKAALEEMIAGLPELPTGTGYVWAPQLKVFGRRQFRLPITFDSSKTPALGELILPPRVLAEVDIAKLGKVIAVSVEKAKSEDPRLLQERVRELEAQIAKRGGTVDMGFLEEAQAAQRELEELRLAVARVPELERALSDLRARASKAATLLQQAAELLVVPNGPMANVEPPQAVRPLASPSPSPSQPAVQVGEITINEPRQAILDAMATLHSIRGAVVTIDWIACTAGTTARARGFEENMRVLRKAGLVEGIRLTQAGAALARATAPPATFGDALDRYSTLLSDPQLGMLRVLKGRPQSPADLADTMRTTERSRGFEENVRQLKKRELIVSGGGKLRLIDWLEALVR